MPVHQLRKDDWLVSSRRVVGLLPDLGPQGGILLACSQVPTSQDERVANQAHHRHHCSSSQITHAHEWVRSLWHCLPPYRTASCSRSWFSSRRRSRPVRYTMNVAYTSVMV